MGSLPGGGTRYVPCRKDKTERKVDLLGSHKQKLGLTRYRHACIAFIAKQQQQQLLILTEANIILHVSLLDYDAERPIYCISEVGYNASLRKTSIVMQRIVSNKKKWNGIHRIPNIIPEKMPVRKNNSRINTPTEKWQSVSAAVLLGLRVCTGSLQSIIFSMIESSSVL